MNFVLGVDAVYPVGHPEPEKKRAAELLAVEGGPRASRRPWSTYSQSGNSISSWLDVAFSAKRSYPRRRRHSYAARQGFSPELKESPKALRAGPYAAHPFEYLALMAAAALFPG